MVNETSKRLSPLNDVVFSKLFEDMSSAQAMLEIINAVLIDAGDEPVAKITDMRSQYALMGKLLGMHGARLDVKATAADGDQFDIEVQLSEMPEMNDRAFFYAGHMLTENHKQGTPYSELPNVRVIAIMDFEVRKNHPDFLQPMGILYRKAPHEDATERYRAYNIELPKFRRVCKSLDDTRGNTLWQWLYLLSTGYKNEAELEVLETMTQGMEAFAKQYRIAMNDPNLHDLYELQLSADRDNAARLEYAERKGRERGREQGLKQGREQGREDTARQLLTMGMPIDQIAKATYLSIEQIQSLPMTKN